MIKECGEVLDYGTGWNGCEYPAVCAEEEGTEHDHSSVTRRTRLLHPGDVLFVSDWGNLYTRPKKWSARK